MRSIALSGTTFENENMCHILKGLNKKQVRVCRRNVELMNSVKKGAEIAIAECQHQFQYRKWNCSTVNKNNEPVFGNALNKGTRESAFVSALSAASVSYSVTKDCTSGQLKSCSCDTSLKRKQPQLNEENWRWAGCSDNVNFGNSFSKSFLDARIRERQDFSRARLLMNIHNNEAGRTILLNKMIKTCKCHGVSGTCALKTCWRQLPSIRTVGDVLKDKFDGASFVKETRTGGRRILVPKYDKLKPPTISDLVYLEASPNFCQLNKQTGSLGTKGRQCKIKSRAIDGCDLLCCGRGYTSRKVLVYEKCDCKFIWCCYVRCKSCQRTLTVHTCL
ncbi:protein Wnt-4-like isoform X2 [Xenia sp. Carnegie-2017]|uniref:protein Wnt-4-like isoform X2 n=1 Tax=Xenia sp. Carnegie-2017 TaxID=2897299 RepID=UPI001F04F9DC|nr:protein Wnt-4-like isoform X2 [Xenia sp. Carnegie-2017]